MHICCSTEKNLYHNRYMVSTITVYLFFEVNNYFLGQKDVVDSIPAWLQCQVTMENTKLEEEK